MRCRRLIVPSTWLSAPSRVLALSARCSRAGLRDGRGVGPRGAGSGPTSRFGGGVGKSVGSRDPTPPVSGGASGRRVRRRPEVGEWANSAGRLKRALGHMTARRPPRPAFLSSPPPAPLAGPRPHQPRAARQAARAAQIFFGGVGLPWVITSASGCRGVGVSGVEEYVGVGVSGRRGWRIT